MKKHFPGHFSPTMSEIKRLWNTCIFAVDANILLNLYRYSDATRKEFLRVLTSIKERLWLPHRAAEEYLENRLTVVSQQEKAYDDTLKTLQNVQNDFKNVRQHPFINEKLMGRLTIVFDQVSKELQQNKQIHSARASQDEIQKDLRALFDDRVGEPFTEEELEAICKEGEERYSKRIPPGFKDGAKTEDEFTASIHRRFGDFIIWRQLLKMSTEQKKGIIFVNDDKKEDWWYIFKGKTIGPRPELIKEFSDKTESHFYMYQSDLFLELAAQHFKQDIKAESVDEVRELRHQDLLRRREVLYRREEEQEQLPSQRHALRERIDQLNNRLAMLQKKRKELDHWQAQVLNHRLPEGDSDPEYLDRHIAMLARTKNVIKEMEKIRYEIEAAEMEYHATQQMYFGLGERGSVSRLD